MESDTVYVVVTDKDGKRYKKAWSKNAEKLFIIRYTMEKYGCDMKYEIDINNIVKVELINEEDYIEDVVEVIKEKETQWDGLYIF